VADAPLPLSFRAFVRSPLFLFPSHAFLAIVQVSRAVHHSSEYDFHRGLARRRRLQAPQLHFPADYPRCTPAPGRLVDPSAPSPPSFVPDELPENEMFLR